MSDEQVNVCPPSYNPADTNSEVGLFEFFGDKLMGRIEKIAPAKVLSYDRNKNRASIQILNQGITSVGGKLTKQPLHDIPVLTLSGGGFAFGFPIRSGDKGWLVACDRDISVFKQSLELYAPATYQKHRYQDGFFIPDKISGFNIQAEDEDAVILTSEDGLTKIAINNGNITIIAADTTINGNLTVNGVITAETVIANNGASGTYSNSVTTENGIVTNGN